MMSPQIHPTMVKHPNRSNPGRAKEQKDETVDSYDHFKTLIESNARMRPTNMPRQQLGQIMANCRRCAPPRVIAWQWVLAGDFETWSGAYPRQAAGKCVESATRSRRRLNDRHR